MEVVTTDEEIFYFSFVASCIEGKVHQIPVLKCTVWCIMLYQKSRIVFIMWKFCS